MKKIIFIFITIFMLYPTLINARELKEECVYNYLSTKRVSGDSMKESHESNYVETTITIKLYDDGSHSGISPTGADGKKIRNWGKEIDGMAASSTDKCPKYIGVVAANLGFAHHWYGIDSKEGVDDFIEKIKYDFGHIFKLEGDEVKVCEYSPFSIKIVYEDATITGAGDSIVTFKPSTELTDYWFNRLNEDCIQLYYCKHETSGFTGADGIYVPPKINYNLYSDENQAISAEEDLSNCEWTNDNGYDRECASFEILEKKLVDSYKQYSNTKNIASVNNIKNNLSSICNTILSYSNYDSPCVITCLDLDNIIKTYDEKYLDKIDIDTRCGISGRLIQFIGKVVKWMKYIVPVIVIVLSMLDFIKATGADKEDEIKKAQNKFIRRLIIAALIFIVPFIIEFVLNKMGFDASGCGIIDL